MSNLRVADFAKCFAESLKGGDDSDNADEVHDEFHATATGAYEDNNNAYHAPDINNSMSVSEIEEGVKNFQESTVMFTSGNSIERLEERNKGNEISAEEGEYGEYAAEVDLASNLYEDNDKSRDGTLSDLGTEGEYKKFLNNMSGLPSEASIDQKQKKGVKMTFYCDICLVQLSSRETMISHSQGSKHIKKQMAVKENLDKEVQMGMLTEDEARRLMPTVRVIPNPESIKKKIPIRLHEKVREAKDPVVGLKFITELMPESDPEMEPHYECQLCGAQGQANGMFSHIMGTRHRERFLSSKLGKSFLARGNISKAVLLREAKKYSENDRRLSDLIKTKKSDRQYPWPPSKAPWTVEKGGSGIPPVGTRDSDTSRAEQALKRPREPSPKEFDELSDVDVGPPSSNAEACRMIEAGRNMVEMAMGFNGSGITEEEAKVFRGILDSILDPALDKLSRANCS